MTKIKSVTKINENIKNKRHFTQTMKNLKNLKHFRHFWKIFKTRRKLRGFIFSLIFRLGRAFMVRFLQHCFFVCILKNFRFYFLFLVTCISPFCLQPVTGGSPSASSDLRILLRSFSNQDIKIKLWFWKILILCVFGCSIDSGYILFAIYRVKSFMVPWCDQWSRYHGQASSSNMDTKWVFAF